MAAPTPAGFNASDVYDGLYLAMAFGAPNEPDAQATFYKTPILTVDDTQTDDEGIPFDPDTPVNRTPVWVRVPCAVEYFDAAGKVVNFGVVQASKIVVTLLGPDYATIVGTDTEPPPFSYVTISGQTFLYQKEEPIVALGSIDVHTVHCQAEDEL